MITFISQSNYIPWIGFIDLIRRSDTYIIYDSMQFTKNDWRNRNLVMAKDRHCWLSIPCGSSISRSIKDVYPVDQKWAGKHWQTIRHCYSKSKFWREYAPSLETLYMSFAGKSLSQINIDLLEYVLGIHEVRTKIIKDHEIIPSDSLLAMEKTQRLVELCSKVSASVYLSAPAAKCYLNCSKFSEKGIDVIFYDYPTYASQEQDANGIRLTLSWVDTLMKYGRIF